MEHVPWTSYGGPLLLYVAKYFMTYIEVKYCLRRSNSIESWNDDDS